jgi:hypothetical protein
MIRFQMEEIRNTPNYGSTNTNIVTFAFQQKQSLRLETYSEMGYD